MLLQNSAMRTPDFADLEDSASDFPKSVELRVKRPNGELLLCNLIVHRSLDDIFWSALNVGRGRGAWASGSCWHRAGRGAQGTHCATIPCVEGAGVEHAQRFRHLFVSVEGRGVGESFALVLNFWCADCNLVGPFTIRQIVML